MVTLINFADETFAKSQVVNGRSGMKYGKFDRIWMYGPPDLPPNFILSHPSALSSERGFGYWIWKPLLILESLKRINPGDYLFYSDSGCIFIDSIWHLIHSLGNDQDVMPFQIQTTEKEWTKRDVLVELNADHPSVFDSKQRMGGLSLWRRSSRSIRFAEEWLEYCSNKKLIDDSPNLSGKENYPGFKEHRHDQSLFSVISKKRGLNAFRDPTQAGNGFTDMYQNSAYPQIIELTRKPDMTMAYAYSKLIFRKTANYLLSVNDHLSS